jgi:alpha-beta hydrolase superfamily lysophospholipase
MLDGGEAVRAAAARWRTPTLLMWAGADRCVAPGGSAAFAAAGPRDVLSSQAYPGLYHEIFNEPERADVVARLTGWLLTHLR